jgi:hypothetical protein
MRVMRSSSGRAYALRVGRLLLAYSVGPGSAWGTWSIEGVRSVSLGPVAFGIGWIR